MWIGLSDAGLLSAVVAAPVEVDMNAGFPVEQGNRSGQNAPQQRYAPEGDATRAVLTVVYPVSRVSDREIIGRICHDTAGYRPGPMIVAPEGRCVDILQAGLFTSLR